MLNATINLFSIDNGDAPYAGAFNYPLRGAKGTLYEGGYPAFIHAPDGVFHFLSLKEQARLRAANMLRHQEVILSFPISALSKKGLNQAEQFCTLSIHIFSCLCSTEQQPGASLASVSSTNQRRTFFKDRQIRLGIDASSRSIKI